MSEHIPAWKRIGLNVQKELESDPLAITTDNTKLSTKQLKKLKRTRTDDKTDSIKKEPKRPKLPKDKKPPPPEKDQLVYLRQFTDDKENWKFAKSKQNWILKNLFKIESKYDVYLQKYVKDLQGGSKDRLVEELKTIVTKWNNITEKLEQKMLQKLEGEGEEEEEEEKKEEKPESEKKEEELLPEYDDVVKAGELIHAMTGEKIELKGIDKGLDESSDVKNDENNLIVEEVEVTDFVTPEDYKDPQVSASEEEKEEPELKKSKKEEKKEKKKKEKKDKKKSEKKEKK